MEIVIIGLGGVGSILCEYISKYLNYSVDESITISLVDGDYYEVKNMERQSFIGLGDKAATKCKEMNLKFQSINFKDYNEFINEDNISSIIPEKSIVFVCVDNHISRKVISDYCSTLNDINVISGGNEYTDGNIQLFQRKGGKNITASLTEYHPEIEYPEDMSPEDMSCEELSKSEPQLLFTNMSVATIMCWVFYSVQQGKDVTKLGEIYFDMISGSTNPNVRNSKLN